MFPANSFCVDRQHKSDREEIKSLKVCSKEYEAMLDEYKNQVDRKILEEMGSNSVPFINIGIAGSSSLLLSFYTRTSSALFS